MKIKKPLSELSKFERCLFFSSVGAIVLSFVITGAGDMLTLIASLIGATALIFVAKGYVVGQILTVVFALFYGIVSFYFRYYGEMITYLCMSAPAAICAVISWLRHPFEGTKEVRVSRLSRKQIVIMVLICSAVTVAFYFILGALGNANLFFSTLSVTTSFLASCLTFFRSPYYALAYGFNDIVLIVLWILASAEDISYVPMVVCFVVFLVNDIYGFLNWKRMQRKQKEILL